MQNIPTTCEKTRVASVIDDYTSAEFQRQALECLYKHLKDEAKYDDATLDLALEKSEYPFQILVPFEDVKSIISLLEKRPGEDDKVRLCLISRVLKLPHVKQCVNNYKIHFCLGTPVTEVDRLFFQFSCRFFPHIPGIREELIHLDLVAKATLAASKTSEEEVQNLSKQMKEVLKQDVPQVVVPKAAPPPAPPKLVPPKKEDVLDSAKKAIDNLFSFRSPEDEGKFLDNVIKAFEIMSEPKPGDKVVDVDKLTKELQEDKIADLLHRIVIGYLPEFFKDELFFKVLKDFLKEAGNSLCFPVPRNATGADKAKLDLILDKVLSFFSMVEKRTEYMNENELTKDVIDEKLLSLVIKIIRKIKSQKLFNPKESTIESLGVWIVSYFILKIILQIFSPITFLNIIHRLLDQPIDLNSLEQSEPSLQYFSINDDPYARMVGSKVKDIATKVVGMGLTKPSPLINFVFSFLTPEKIGVVVTQYYNRTLNSPCSMKPVLLAHHILLKDGKPVLPATQMPVNTISTRMVRDIYPLIKKALDEKAGFFSDWGARLSEIEPMLQTLGGNLDKIFNDTLTLKLLAHLLLKEVDKQLTV